MRKPIELRQGLKVAGHPLHAALIHFPMAFLLAAFPLQLAGWLGWNQGWMLGFWAQAAGFVTALPAAATGLINLAGLSGRPAALALANRHMLVMLSAVAASGCGLFLQGGPEAVQGGTAFAILGLSLTNLALLTLGGWLGAEMVFRHGVAQEKD